MKLSAYQKKYLKSLSHAMKANTQIGKEGLSESLIQKIDKDLSDHELLKIKALESADLEIKETASLLAEKLNCTVIKVIGRTIVLFRENPLNEKDTFTACGAYGSKNLLHKTEA
ncbi:MAG TPA: ribosome assembly RNA-binding protein YhbY [Spirochaetia bacterium]|nr:MAG: hypothetical protein A2Y41_13355 [Spirochaetes bacterium GWB1_36_13]HCL57815.1 ribosome assembly RNA-binding protein YhbY [Spirochaetia bacterium]